MGLPDSAVYQVCRTVADHVKLAFQSMDQSIDVRIGAPAAVSTDTDISKHRLNFFFHRFEPSGIRPDSLPAEPCWIRIHCVVTAFASEEDNVSAGENDLRLIGEVIRIFHETPIVEVGSLVVDGAPVRVQMALLQLSLDDINRLWSTQQDTPYRPSVGYELSLVPVLPATPFITPPKVGAFGVNVTAAAVPPLLVKASPPPFALPPIDLSQPDWAIQIAFVAGAACAQSLVFEVGSDELTQFSAQVAIAGKIGEQVTLRWEVWDAEHGWRAAGQHDALIQAERIEPSSHVTLELPFKNIAGQAMLYAVRTRIRPDGTSIAIRSNPLLVTLYAGGDT